MRFLALGIIVLLLLILAGKLFLKADPKVLAKQVRPIGISFAIVLAIVLTLTGRWGMARRLLAGVFGFLGPFSPFGTGATGASGTGRGRGGRPGASRVRTAVLEMELDHASGEMYGRIVSGGFAGRALEDLAAGEVAALLRECLAAGDQSAAVLTAWLDRYHPEWRTDDRFKEGAGEERDDGGRRSAAMTPDEAREVLGLGPDASDQDIRRAHKRLMKQFHPDQGGSDYLASKINEAKDVLLGK